MNDSLSEQARVVIVDDTPENLELLESFLEGLGFRVFALPNGEMALKAIARSRPDIVLLDIVMPGMNGYEVCRRLKADPATADIPVIFLSALAEPRDKIQAFAAGGVDYVAKPLQMEEVQARVRTHVELSRRKRELEANCQRLRDLERLRDNLTHMIVHDLRAPLTVIGFNLEMLRELVPSLSPEVAEIFASTESNTRRLAEMIAQLLDLGRLESGQMPLRRIPASLLDLVHSVRQSVAALAGDRPLAITSTGLPEASCDADLLGRVLANLLANAFKHSPDGAGVEVAVDGSADHVRVAITDCGPGIPAEDQARIFDKFAQLESRSRRSGFGIGLAFCRLAVEAHGGRIGVMSEVDRGSTFWFVVPRHPPEQPTLRDSP
jgi:signal transduction histidine kinase